MNKVTLFGILTNDVMLKTSINNKKFTYFTVAVDGYQQRVNYINCVAWDHHAEEICSVNKGSQVLVSGYLITRRDNAANQTIMEVVINNVTVISCKKQHLQDSETKENQNSNLINANSKMSQAEIEKILKEFDEQ